MCISTVVAPFTVHWRSTNVGALHSTGFAPEYTYCEIITLPEAPPPTVVVVLRGPVVVLAAGVEVDDEAGATVDGEVVVAVVVSVFLLPLLHAARTEKASSASTERCIFPGRNGRPGRPSLMTGS